MSSQPQPAFNLDFNQPPAGAAAPATAPPDTAPTSKPKFNLDFGQPPVAAPKFNLDFSAPPAVAADQSPPKDTEHSWLTRSIIQDVAGTNLPEAGRQKVVGALKSVLPASMQGNYLTDLADEVSKAGPEFVNFLTSPMGIGLTVAHLFPASAPYAAAADFMLGGQQALQAIPDVADAAMNIKDPHKVGRALVDVLGAYAGLKGGSHIADAVRSIPADTGAGLSFAGQAKAMAGAYGDAFHSTAPTPALPAPGARGAELRTKLEAAAPEDRPAIIAEAAKPANLREKAERSLYRAPGIGAAANVLAPRVRMPAILDLGQNLVDEYIGNINEHATSVRGDMDWIQRNVPEADRKLQQMGFAMEGDEPNSPLSPSAEPGLEKIRKLNRDLDEKRRQAGLPGLSDAALRDPDTYLRHYWDFDAPGGEPAKRAISTRMMRDPSIQARTVGSLKLGMAPVEEGGYGLTPKYDDITDVVYRRQMEGIRSIENQKFAQKLRDYGLLVDPTKANTRGLDWPAATDSPALKRAMYAGQNKAGDTIMRDVAPLVHPDIQMAVNAIYNEPFQGVGWNAINQLRAFSKQIAVGYSMFHNNIISEVSQAQAAGAGGLAAIPRVAKAFAWPLDPEFIKGVKASIWEIRGRHGAAPDAPPYLAYSPDTVQPWIKPGLSFRSAESESVAIRNAMDFMKNRGPIVKALGLPVRALGNAQYIFNRALFDYYLPGQILHSAEHLYAAEANRLGPNPTPEAEFGLRKEISDHLNRSYGAENWQHLLLTPKAQQAIGMTFFAPMWMTSRLRTLSKGFETTAGTRLTSRYLGGAALTMFLTSQLANYALSSWYGDPNRYPNGGGEYQDDDTKEWKRGGHFTWQNPGDPVKLGGKYVPGVNSHTASVYFGQNPDGSQRYISFDKPFADSFRMLTHPDSIPEMIGEKLSLPLQALITQISKHEPGTGFEAVEKDRTPEQQDEQRLAAAARPFLPFSAEGYVQQLEHHMDPEVFREPGAVSQFYGLPARKGASFEQSVQEYRAAIEAGREDVADKVLQNAAINGISSKAIIKAYTERLRTEGKRAAGVPKTEPPPGR